jgi:hypothetical protein
MFSMLAWLHGMVGMLSVVRVIAGECDSYSSFVYGWNG